MSDKTALIAGATGLVGKELVRLILTEHYYKKVIVITRRPLVIKDNRLEEVIIKDFDKLEDHKELFNVEHIYCCLGTTMKQAGSKEMFKKIDLDYPLKMAELSKDQPNFESYHIVTAVGSDPESALFYNEVKGEVEQKLKEMDIRALKIYQPSLLLGYRDHFRLWEELAKIFTSILAFFVVGSRRTRYWSIHGKDVAKCMFIVAKQNREGLEVFSPKAMIEIAHM